MIRYRYIHTCIKYVLLIMYICYSIILGMYLILFYNIINYIYTVLFWIILYYIFWNYSTLDYIIVNHFLFYYILFYSILILPNSDSMLSYYIIFYYILLYVYLHIYIYIYNIHQQKEIMQGMPGFKQMALIRRTKLSLLCFGELFWFRRYNSCCHSFTDPRGLTH